MAASLTIPQRRALAAFRPALNGPAKLTACDGHSLRAVEALEREGLCAITEWRGRGYPLPGGRYARWTARLTPAGAAS